MIQVQESKNETRIATVYVALIHNNDKLRYAHIRPELEKLVVALEPEFPATIIEISFQPEIRPHKTALAFSRDFTYARLEYSWSKYRKQHPIFLRHLLYFFRRAAKKYIFNIKNELGRWRKSSAIEVAVTNKHVRAWDRFLDSDRDIILCFEDDAVFLPDSGRKLKKMLQYTFSETWSGMCYADVGGGLSIDTLKISKLISRITDEYVIYGKPVTNTACAYLLNRPLAAKFLEILSDNPLYRLIAVDLMMNKLFIEIGKKGEECFCFHAAPLIVRHGSIMGDYSSLSR